MSNYLSILFAALLSIPIPAGAQQITLLQTSDVHGHIYPFDYFRNQPADIGLARIATWVETVRAEGHPVLLLDAGDTIQGSALAYYHHRHNPVPPEPTMKVMSHMGFDAMTVGNHEFNFGLKAIDKSVREAGFPWLSANIINDGDGTPYFQPYIVKELEGIRVGILGLTTPNIPNWETPEHYTGLGFLGTVETARRYVPLLREKEKVDTVIVLTHQGLERDLETLRSNETEHENQVFRLLTEVPGIDVVLMGHSHRDVEPRELEDVVICEPGGWGEALCRIDLFFEKDPSGDVRLARWSGELLRAADVEEQQEVLDVARSYHEQTMAYINSVIGEAAETVSAENARFRDTPLMDLLQEVMLAESGADLSLAALLPRTFVGLPAGPITVQQILSFYIYDNTLVVLEVTGRDIKEALEQAARYYEEASLDPEGGRLQIATNPRVAGYNFDILAGARVSDRSDSTGGRTHTRSELPGQTHGAELRVQTGDNQLPSCRRWQFSYVERGESRLAVI